MFDPRTQVPNNQFQISNPTSPTDDSFGTMNFGDRAKKSAQNYENYRIGNGGGVQFIQLREGNKEDESGVSSPPLWKTSPPISPLHNTRNNYRYISPNSRVQAIAKGQWELMEMVKNMPESCYELSLRDLVEKQPRVDEEKAQEEECFVEEKSFDQSSFDTQSLNPEASFDTQPLNPRVKVFKKQGSEKKENKAKVLRSRSIENGGLLLKMVFPFSLGSKKRTKISTTTITNSTCSRVSPKPEALDNKPSRGVINSISGRSGSSGSSSSSRSNSGRKSGCSIGCWSFFLSKKKEKTTK